MIYLFLAEGFEEIEAITVLDILRRAEIDIKSVSLSSSLNVKGAHSIVVSADISSSDLDMENIEMVILPGGMPGTKNLFNSQLVKDCISHCIENDLRVAAICAAPIVLGKLGCLKNKKATCFPGFENDLIGAELVNSPCLTDKNITTANGPGSATKFALEIVSLLKGKELAAEISKSMQVI